MYKCVWHCIDFHWKVIYEKLQVVLETILNNKCESNQNQSVPQSLLLEVTLSITSLDIHVVLKALALPIVFFSCLISSYVSMNYEFA